MGALGPKADAIVVLGCRIDDCGEPSPALSRRLTMALQAYRQGRADRVVVSGGRQWGTHVEAVVMQKTLVSWGLPQDRIWLEACSLTTGENAWYTARLAAENGVRRVVLVTCDFHLPRARACFEASGLECTAAPVATPGGIRRSRAFRERLSRILDAISGPTKNI